jgi:perosamine synthetase
MEVVFHGGLPYGIMVEENRFMRFQASKPVLAGNEKKYVQEALDSGWISGHGPFITRFEQAVSDFLGLEDGIAAASGTAALHLAMRSLGVEQGDDVIVPALTFVACPNAVRYCGGNPVFADCDPITRNLTPDSIRAALTERTRGVMLVHMFGSPGPVQSIRRLCDERGIWLLEDCAHSFGARTLGRSVGATGEAAAFSFYGNKVISTGEGGMVFVKDAQKREFIRCLREQGMDPDRRNWHVFHGYNYRMSNLAAALGCGQVEMADFHVAERRRVAGRYRRNLQSLADAGVLQLPVEAPEASSVYWLYSVVLCGGDRSARDLVQERARREFGIQTRPFYVPMHKLPIYRQDVSLPHSEFLGDHGFVLPTYSGLKDDEVDEICRCLQICISG